MDERKQALHRELSNGGEWPSLHRDSSSDDDSDQDETAPLLTPAASPANGLRRQLPVSLRIRVPSPPHPGACASIEQDGALVGPPAGERQHDEHDSAPLLDAIAAVLRMLLVLAVVVGVSAVVVIARGMDEEPGWPLTQPQGWEILRNMPAGFLCFAISDMLAWSITRGWLCNRAGIADKSDDPWSDADCQAEPVLLSIHPQGGELGDEAPPEQEDACSEADASSEHEPHSACHVVLQALQAGLLGAVSVGVLDSLWLNRLNVLLPPETDMRNQAAALRLLSKSLLDSVVYGGLSNSFGIVVRRCLFKSESLSESLQVWRQCILQVMANELAFWPLWNALNFAMMPPALQVACTGLGGCVWNTYISLMALSEAQHMDSSPVPDTDEVDGERGEGHRIILSPSRTWTTPTACSRPPTLLLSVSSPTAFSARLAPRSSNLQDGTWSGNLAGSVHERERVSYLLHHQQSRRTSPTRHASPLRVWGGQGGGPGSRPGSPLVPWWKRLESSRAAERGPAPVSDEARSPVRLLPVGAASARDGGDVLRVSISVSVPVPRFPLEGRVSTPAPEAWRRRRAVCTVVPGDLGTNQAQERNMRSHSLPTRPSPLSSPLLASFAARWRASRDDDDAGSGANEGGVDLERGEGTPRRREPTQRPQRRLEMVWEGLTSRSSSPPPGETRALSF